MKAFLICCALVLACRADLTRTGMCAHAKAAGAPLDKINQQTRDFLLDVFEGNCKINGGSFVDYFFKESGCKEFLEQGYCYYVVEGRRQEFDGVTFDRLRASIPDAAALATTLCANKCTKNILPYIFACYTDPAIKPKVVRKISSQFQWLKGEARKYNVYLQDSPLGRIIAVGLQRWKVWADVGQSIKKHRAALIELISDFRNNFGAFCNANCASPAANYVTSLVNGVNKGECDAPRAVCGPCATNAAAFVSSNGANGDNMPCCVKNFYDFIIRRTDKGANGWIAKNGVLLGEVAYLSTQNADFQCVRSIYDPLVATASMQTCAGPVY